MIWFQGEGYEEACARSEAQHLEQERERLIQEWDDKIHRARAKHGRLMNSNHTTCPHSRLPDELLALIFETTRRLTWPIFLVEITLSHVSSRWRNVAINDSALWTNIEVSVARPTAAPRAYTHRSRNRPVSITIDFCGSDKSDLLLTKMLIPLDPAILRCQRLLVKANSDPRKSIYLVLNYLVNDSMPLLEKIQIELEDYEGIVQFRHPRERIILFHGAPRLSFIDLVGFGLHSYFPPFSGLTTLYLHTILPEARWEYTAFQRFAASLPALTNLSIHGEPLDANYVNQPSGKILFPVLRALRLRYDDDEEDSWPCLWLNITAPLLESLYLINSLPCDIEALKNARGNGAIFPSVQSLTVESSNYDRDTFLQLAIIAPSVKQFTCIELFNPALEHLRDSQLWPDLETVRLWGEKNSDVNNFKIRDMLRSRISNKKPIAKVFVPNKPPLFPAWLLREYVALEVMHRPLHWPNWEVV